MRLVAVLLVQVDVTGKSVTLCTGSYWTLVYLCIGAVDQGELTFSRCGEAGLRM